MILDPSVWYSMRAKEELGLAGATFQIKAVCAVQCRGVLESYWSPHKHNKDCRFRDTADVTRDTPWVQSGR